MKNKIVILGGSGFIGKVLCQSLSKKKVKFKSLNSKNCNLLQKSSLNILKKTVKDKDTLVFISAVAPCKSYSDLCKNLLMLKPLINLSKFVNISQLIYISSDAVYKDSINKINESSLVEPNSFHGVMHQIRENTLKLEFSKKLSIIRPTLIYGPQDTHNGYGPNYFARRAKKNKDIQIFGNGEEIRDHVFIDDVIKLIFKIFKKKKTGIFNAVSGKPTTFLNLAKLIIKQFKSSSKIIKKNRNGPMPHNGFRCFNRKKIVLNFLSLKATHYKKGVDYLKNIKDI